MDATGCAAVPACLPVCLPACLPLPLVLLQGLVDLVERRAFHFEGSSGEKVVGKWAYRAARCSWRGLRERTASAQCVYRWGIGGGGCRWM